MSAFNSRPIAVESAKSSKTIFIKSGLETHQLKVEDIHYLGKVLVRQCKT